MYAKKAAFHGIMLALAMIASYIDGLIPLLPMLPGIKLGLTNLIFIALIHNGKYIEASVINFTRILLTAFLFGNAVSAIYSLCGALFSFTVMIILSKTQKFSFVGISGAGGFAHNIGQLIAAYFLLGSSAVIAYLPYLAISGIILGALVGLLSGIINNRTSNIKSGS